MDSSSIREDVPLRAKDCEAASHCKKRPREEEAEDAARKWKSGEGAISRSVTTDEDDVPAPTLLGQGDATSAPLPSFKLSSNAPSDDSMTPSLEALARRPEGESAPRPDPGPENPAPDADRSDAAPMEEPTGILAENAPAFDASTGPSAVDAAAKLHMPLTSAPADENLKMPAAPERKPEAGNSEAAPSGRLTDMLVDARETDASTGPPTVDAATGKLESAPADENLKIPAAPERKPEAGCYEAAPSGRPTDMLVDNVREIDASTEPSTADAATAKLESAPIDGGLKFTEAPEGKGEANYSDAGPTDMFVEDVCTNDSSAGSSAVNGAVFAKVESSPDDENLKMPAAPEGKLEVDPPARFATLPPPFQTLPPVNMEKFVERWTCDVCKSCSFETFEEAQAHEIQCKLYHDSRREAESERQRSQRSEVANVLSSLALRPPQRAEEEGGTAGSGLPPARHPAIDLVPRGDTSSMLSDYNNLLVRNIEFFYPSADNRVGLRCIHCKDHPSHITAATFFPSSIGSISAGLGTIGARHFGWKKCPFIQPEIVQQMIETKKTSGLQTRDRGRVGLDAYCKNIAKQYGMFDDNGNAGKSGVFWIEGTEPNLDATDDLMPRKMSTSSRESARSSSADESVGTDSNSIASVLAKMKHDANIETRPFVPSDTQFFWECSGCRSVPFDFRAKGSVVFSAEEPPRSKVESHLRRCNGGRPLAIPHSAAIEPYYGRDVPTIKVKWESNKRSSGRIRRSLEANSIKSGVEDVPLCFEEDRQFTTDFAYFTVTHLKKCYLTRAGGSRGTCPVGYPGLACGYCAGNSNERRFFYTSADHLRNSFSHIPSHMAECVMCPTEVKERLEELKTTRNRQKSLLKPGYHKIFIDRVWERMHGSALTEDDTDDEGYAPHNPRTKTLAERESVLVHDNERESTSDLTFFTLLQLAPYRTPGDEVNSREIGFPGLVCGHCMKRPNGRKFFTTSSEHLGDLLLTISDHLEICKECPAAIKSRVSIHKTSHQAQLRQLKEGEHAQLMDRVWKRLITLDQRDSRPRRAPSSSAGSISREPVEYETVDPNAQLVKAGDESLVTPFTYFSMQQVQPCNLDNSSNGARSAFDFGFPGLECRHCSGMPNSRRFFYRTAEILAGNYAHIPNHLAVCSACPTKIKRDIKLMREDHAITKHELPKGSQKEFFNRVWARLHVPLQKRPSS